jgi:hypothetical protein
VKGGIQLTLNGKLLIEGKIVRESTSEDNDGGHNFRDKLENCLLELCSALEIPVPLWLKKNTRELAVFRKTFLRPNSSLRRSGLTSSKYC